MYLCNCGIRGKYKGINLIKLGWGTLVVFLVAGSMFLVACDVEEEVRKEQAKHAITLRQFRSVEFGTSQAEVERKLGRPEDKQEFEGKILPEEETQHSSCIYYNEKGAEAFEGRSFQFCFDEGKLTSKNSY
jgi:hypothetical protein